MRSRKTANGRNPKKGLRDVSGTLQMGGYSSTFINSECFRMLHDSFLLFGPVIKKMIKEEFPAADSARCGSCCGDP